MRAVAAGLTDVGLHREHNEDRFAVEKQCDLYVVADGMGGQRAGEVASMLATEEIVGHFRHRMAGDEVTVPTELMTYQSDEENHIVNAVRIANRQIFERAVRSRDHQGMGSTVVCALFSPRQAKMIIGHVGDSRCYRFRAGRLHLLTRDHSLVNDYAAAMPDLAPDQIAELPKNVITRALGMQDQVVVDIQTDAVEIGDVYLLCSDGLSGMVGDDVLEKILSSTTEPKAACARLIQAANENGGEDNVTAVVVRICDDAAAKDDRVTEASLVAQVLFEEDTAQGSGAARGNVFVSYRRDDSGDVTGRIVDRLVAKLGRESVFRDVDNIPLGVDVRKYISDTVHRCGLVLAIIGPGWADAKDARGRRRLDDPADFVRIEIAVALARDIPVVPVLVGGATIPDPSALPKELQALAYRNGMAVRRDPDFHTDMDRLINGLAHLFS